MAWLLAAEEGLAIGGVEIGETVAKWLEVAAIAAITVAIVAAVIRSAVVWVQSDGDAAFQAFKRGIGRGMLVGLDLLIAADIIPKHGIMAGNVFESGSQVMQRIAAPMVGGLVSSALLTLIVVPSLYYIVYRRRAGAPR